MLLISSEHQRVLSLPLLAMAAALALGSWLAVMLASGAWSAKSLITLVVVFAVSLFAVAVGLRGVTRVDGELRWFSIAGHGRASADRCDLWPVIHAGRPNIFELELRDQDSDALLHELFSIVHGPTAEAKARAAAEALGLPLALPESGETEGQRQG